jgi:hypothetical protein
MRVSLALVISTSLALGATLPAEAQQPPGSGSQKKLYRWTDADGKVHYTDQLPPEAVGNERERLNTQGIAVDKVEREMTPAEREAHRIEQARLAEEAKRQAELDKMDAVLMGSYPNESDLTRAYKERFDLLEQSLESARVGIRSQEKSMADMLAHAANLERSGKPVPETVVQSIALTRKQVEEQRGYLAKRESERAALQQEYDRLLARHRELRGLAPAARDAAKDAPSSTAGN